MRYAGCKSGKISHFGVADHGRLPKNPKVEHRRNLLILLTFSEKLNIEHSVLCRMFSFLARK